MNYFIASHVDKPAKGQLRAITYLPKGMKRTLTTLGWIYIEGLTAGAAAQLLTKANNHAKQ